MPFSCARSAISLPTDLGGRNVAAVVLLLGLLAERRGGSESDAVQVVDELRVDVVQRAVDIETGALGRAGHLLADAGVDALADYVTFAWIDHSFFLPSGVARVLATFG